MPEDKDAEASAHLEVTEDQDTESSAYPEVPEDQDEEESAHPEVTVVGDRDYVNTYKTPEYFRTMDIDIEHIDKNDKNTHRTIYKAIDVLYFGEVKLSTKVFLYQCKKNPNYPKNI